MQRGVVVISRADGAGEPAAEIEKSRAEIATLQKRIKLLTSKLHSREDLERKIQGTPVAKEPIAKPLRKSS